MALLSLVGYPDKNLTRKFRKFPGTTIPCLKSFLCVFPVNIKNTPRVG